MSRSPKALPSTDQRATTPFQSRRRAAHYTLASAHGIEVIVMLQLYRYSVNQTLASHPNPLREKPLFALILQQVSLQLTQAKS